VERILVARHGGIETDVEVSRKQETQRRIQEIVRGQVEGVPSEVVMARARCVA
jgi:hypothetical protein